MNTSPTPPFAMTAPQLAELFGLTSRRVRQYVDDRLMAPIERGRFDAAWFLYVRIGEKRTENMRKRPGRDTLAALGWMNGINDKPDDEAVAAFCSLFERNGLGRDAALMAIGEAKAILAK